MWKHHFTLIIWGVAVTALCLSLLRSILLAQEAHRQVEQQKETVEVLKNQIQDLERQVKNATSSFELERRAREELNRQKPNEQIIDLQRP